MTTKTELKIEIDARHRYTINGKPAAGVTKVLGFKDKSLGLMPWAAGCASEFALEDVARSAAVFSLLRDDPYVAGTVAQQFARFLDGQKLDALLGENETVNHALRFLAEMRNAHRERKETAASRGKAVHEAIEHHLRGEEVGALADPLVANGFAAYLSWQDAIGFSPLGVEVKVGSASEMVAGTLDAVGVCGTGDIALLDWKTGKGIYDTHYAQAATYARYWEQMNAERVGAIFVVRLDKETGAPEPHQVSAEMRAEGERMFAGCLAVYRSSAEMGKLMRRAK
ncbi:MAG: hypothetical protein M0R06_21615 [Sphaerochaeta sp.]|jgi:hypothetical protein|nr:hypothetical protein [Sphaerochaeta sp.]